MAASTEAHLLEDDTSSTSQKHSDDVPRATESHSSQTAEPSNTATAINNNNPQHGQAESLDTSLTVATAGPSTTAPSVKLPFFNAFNSTANMVSPTLDPSVLLKSSSSIDASIGIDNSMAQPSMSTLPVKDVASAQHSPITPSTSVSAPQLTSSPQPPAASTSTSAPGIASHVHDGSNSNGNSKGKQKATEVPPSSSTMASDTISGQTKPIAASPNVISPGLETATKDTPTASGNGSDTSSNFIPYAVNLKRIKRGPHAPPPSGPPPATLTPIPYAARTSRGGGSKPKSARTPSTNTSKAKGRSTSAGAPPTADAPTAPLSAPQNPPMALNIPVDLGTFSLPSEGLFPSDPSNMADLFGPGSAALFDQLQAAMRISPEAPSWSSSRPTMPTQQQVSDQTLSLPSFPNVQNDDSDDSDDNDADDAFTFDLDAQLQAAMSGVPASQAHNAGITVAPSTSDLQTTDQPNQVATTASVFPGQSQETPQSRGQIASAVPSKQHPTVADGKSDAESDDDDDDDDDAADANVMTQFDLDAMLASAMGQATTSENANAVMQADTAPVQPPEKLEEPVKSKEPAGSSDTSDDDDGGDEGDGIAPAFDLDAHLREAMELAKLQPPQSPGEEVIDIGTPLGPPTSDESSDEEGFDLDAQIGAALAGQPAAPPATNANLEKKEVAPQPSREKTQPKEASPDFMAHDLQNMLQAAMKQAALELEEEQQEQTSQMQTMVQAARQQAQAYPGYQPQMPIPTPFVPKRFALPARPRTRPRVDDDGDPENAYNRSRIAHPQALHTPYKCDFRGCDKVFAKQSNYLRHRQTHQGNAPYRCHVCPASFATNQEFKEHSWTHNRTREWKYRCRACFNLFGDKSMFDQHVKKAIDPRCSKGECELQMRPAGARINPPTVPPSSSKADANAKLPNHDNYFGTSIFDQPALLAATLVHQMSSLLARQYDRQTSLLGPNDPRIDVKLALRQTFQRAGLTPNEMAALATVIATVGHARNEGLKASLDEARKAQFEAYRSHQERQRKEAIKQIKRERQRIRQDAEKTARAAAAAKRKADAAAREAKRKEVEAEANKNADIPVPQAVM